MKVAIVGPTHPYKGGIAKHTTQMAHKLAAAGHEVTILSWKHQYPFFYPGQQFVPNNQPEVTPFENTVHVLSWRSPYGWLRAGKRLRSYDKVIFVWWVPTIQGPVYWTMLRALSGRAKTMLLCHNVLPHEPKPGDRQLARKVFGKVDSVLVHSDAQATVAGEMGNRPVFTATLPPVFPPKSADYAHPTAVTKMLLFFGLVRPYKGLDVLLRALAEVPDVNLTIAGEIWGEDIYMPLAERLGISDRVTFIRRYVADDELQELFSSVDAVVLPYRGGTATFNVAYAHYFGLPVIATNAASMGKQVSNGTDGLLCEPDNAAALTDSIKKLYTKGELDHLRQGIPEITDEAAWKDYIAVVAGD
jgi:glycosyltransferase involved in cell wall biosynthesis